MLARIALIAALAALCGCASKATMDARYDASLQRWRGATRAELEAGWGRPRLAQDMPGGQVLTWTLRVDVDDRDVRGAAPSVAVARGTPGGGGVNGVGSAVVNTGALAPATVPITCTTHFTLKDGRVVSWTFEGLGCGAPT